MEVGEAKQKPPYSLGMQNKISVHKFLVEDAKKWFSFVEEGVLCLK